MAVKKTPMRKYKHKRQIKDSRLKTKYIDKKGHTVYSVHIRKHSHLGIKRIPYYYCPKCNLFFKLSFQKVILVG